MREPKETIPPRTMDEEQEDEIIRLLESHQKMRLQEDPMRELEEALMDRTTASLNRRQKITQIQGSIITMKEVGDLSVFTIENNFNSPTLSLNKKGLNSMKQKKKGSLELKKCHPLLESSFDYDSKSNNNSIK